MGVVEAVKVRRVGVWPFGGPALIPPSLARKGTSGGRCWSRHTVRCELGRAGHCPDLELHLDGYLVWKGVGGWLVGLSVFGLFRGPST